MMKMHKRIISIVLTVALVFSNLPAQLMNFERMPYTYADGGTPIIDLGYDDFSSIDNLKLNGSSLIEGNAIQFKKVGDIGGSVFTENKVALGEELSFSTAFSFRNISPSTPVGGSKGGFTFTLQSADNSKTISDFQDESVDSSLSIAFTTDYWETGPTTRLMKQDKNLRLASLTNFKLAMGPNTRCEISAVPYLNGDYNNPIPFKLSIDTDYMVDEISDYYHVWMGYDGEEELLYVLSLNPSGEYRYFSYGVDLADEMLPNEVYAGFMGSFGDAGNTIEIDSWYFKNDLSIMDEAAVDADKAWLTSEMEAFEANPNSDYFFPLKGQYGSTISWESSNTDVVAEDGTVTPSSLEQGDQMVKLTATITKGSVNCKTRLFTITVKVPDTVIVSADQDWLTDSRIRKENSDLVNIVSDIFLPTSGQYGSTISWVSNKDTIVNMAGKVTRPVYGAGDQGVSLTAIITMGGTTEGKTFNIIVKALGMDDGDIMQADYDWLTSAQLLNENIDLSNITSDMLLHTSGQYGSNISWASDKDTIVNTEGVVTRPSYINGDETVVLTATIKKGEATITKEFAVRVIKLDQTDEGKLEADKTWLTELQILKDNTSLDHIIGDLTLPAVGPSGSLISWTSDKNTIINGIGEVTRPSYTNGDEAVVLTATISKGASTTTKTFTIKVIKLDQTDVEKMESDKAWLTELQILKDNISLDNIIGDLILPDIGPSGSIISWASDKNTIINGIGEVARPSYTNGDETVVLTATIRKGTSTTAKTFMVKVIKLDQTDAEKDAEKVNADYQWLMDAIISKGKFALNDVTEDLNLPAEGENGSEITWISDNAAVNSVNGTVTRPIYGQGSKAVTLTATIRMGLSVKEKIFRITVKAKTFITSEELVAMDYERLTEAQILNGNSSLDNITKDMHFPIIGTYVPGGSHISWWTTNHGIITLDGRVNRPMFHSGDQTITLTATIKKESASLIKTFVVTVKCLDLTDDESVTETSKWLKGYDLRYEILNGNTSANAITQNLFWPPVGSYGSTITWSSNKPDIISNDGIVTRPAYKTGSKSVNVIATIVKGDRIEEVPFQYIVLEEPDKDAPAISSTIPGNNSTGVLWDTNKIIITYSEDIVLIPNSEIELKAKDVIQVVTRAEKNKLIITPLSALSAGENRIFIPAGAVTDVAGNPTEDYGLNFTVEEKPIRNIEVISSAPYDYEKDVDVHISEISFRFNSEDIVEGTYFNKNIVLTAWNEIPKSIPATCSLSGDTVRVKLKEALPPATICSITIYQGVVQDRFLNKSSPTSFQFKTKGTPPPEVIIPKIASVYPADGQTGVSVKPNIEVVFSNVQKLKGYPFTLTDELGNICPLYAPYTLDIADTKLIFKPQANLKPNMVYTLSGPYGSVEDPYEQEFSTQFTTGVGPQIVKTTPSTGDWDASTRGIVEITFDTPVKRGANFKDIVFKNYFGHPVEFTGEEKGSKVILRTLSELDTLPYTIYIPCGAYENSSKVANSQNIITFYAKKEKLPVQLESACLDILDTGFVKKGVKISIDTIQMPNWESYVRSLGYGPIKYEWSIDGNLISTAKLFYHTFYNPGDYKITLTAKDKYDFAYVVEKTIKIKTIDNARMSLKDDGIIYSIRTSETGEKPALNFDLRLEQENQFIFDEEIGVKLYKDNVLQPLSKYGNGEIFITSRYEDNTYRFTYTPEYGDAGTYEMVFTYKGVSGEQVIRKPFVVISKKPNVTDVFRFRLYDKKAGYSEFLNYVYVILNGERIKANKEMYTYNGDTFPVYAIHKTLQTNSYYYFNVEDWYDRKYDTPFYLGKDTDTPTILYGSHGSLRNNIQIIDMTVNTSESDLKELDHIYFKGFSTKLVFNVEGDWAGVDPGYYEIATSSDARSSYEDTGYKINFVQNHNSKNKIQKIAVQPGIQLKDDSMHYFIRMVSAQGYKSPWNFCGGIINIEVLPVPSILGKKLNISVQDREYAVDWPTVFDGPIGGTIGFLEDIPVIDGGSFGLGGGMPSLEGYFDPWGDIELDFEAKGGYGESSKTSKATKFKKLKKVTVVGYEFEIEMQGGITLTNNYKTKEWSITYARIRLGGDFTKKWDEGYKILGVGFTAGVGVGGGVYGTLIIENGDEYSGIVEIIPHANLHVDGDFAVASVKGSLNAKIPAEIHFPTGYIGANITVDADIRAKALLWSKTIYEKELCDIHWDNGKPKIVLKSLGMPIAENGDSEDAGMQLIPRDYLGRQSNWVGGNTRSLVLQCYNGLKISGFMEDEEENNPKIMNMQENIFPEAEIVLIDNGGQQWLVWVDDNPSRDDLNRTQLRYSIFKDGVWSSPKWIYDDGTADFAPAITTIGNGILMAWHNIGKTLIGDEGLDDALKSSEICVTESVYTADGSQPVVINLTKDDKTDHSPRIAADGDRALLVWTKSEGLGISLDGKESSPSNSSSQFYFSTWRNGIWAAPEAIEMELSTVVDSSLTVKGEEGLLLYTRDMDNDFSTGEDREVYARLYDGNAWGEAIRLTDNLLNDFAPKVVVVEGEWFITWLEDGKILYRIGLSGETRTEEALENIQSNYQITAKEGNRPLVALVYTQPSEDKALHMYTSFYDFDKEKWSDKIGLVTGNNYTGDISAHFDQKGKLNAAFTQAEIITEAKQEMMDGVEKFVEVKNISDKVDLKLLAYTPVHDIAFSKEGMLLSTEFPLPSALTTVYVTLVNGGDFTENVVVSLFDGNPEEGGTILAKTMPQLIAGHSTKDMEISWLVGTEGKSQYDIYAVAQTIDGVQEKTLDNNIVNTKVYTSDIAIEDLTCENAAGDDYLINVSIVNRGSRALEQAKVWLENEASGEVQETTLLEKLDIGEKTALTYMISSNGRKNMRVRVTLPEGVNESNTENNNRSFLLEPALFVLKSLNIGPGEKQVDVASAIIIEWNMSIDQGVSFDQIRLIDEDFNFVGISKVIKNNTLTIKPQNLLEHGTQYQLTIPVDALGDSYGHTIEEAFNMNFTTMTTNPEVVSVYPGKDMRNTSIDTAIQVRFNQNVIKGHEFTKLTLLEHGDKTEVGEVPVVGSISGELLTINYAGSLNKNTTYTVEIPRGALENEKGETQKGDYLLAFTTGETGERDEMGETDITDRGDKGDKSTSSSTMNEHKISINLENRERTVEIHTQEGKAVIKLGALAKEMFSGDKEVIINIPSIAGVNSYSIEMPADTLSDLDKKATLIINTDIGSITIPSGMLFSMEDMEEKTVRITIETIDKSLLTEQVRAAIGNRPVLRITMIINGKEINWYNLDAPVRVSIPYTPAALELKSLESIVIWYIDANDSITTIPNGYYNQSMGTVGFSTTHFSDFAVAYNKEGFKDVLDKVWYEKAVSFIAARGITVGTGNGNFSPDNRLTRGQFITMLMKAYGIEPDIKPGDNFLDSGSTWYTGYLAATKRLGISQGVGNNRFAPDNEITRQEMFTLLYNTLKVMKQMPKIKESGKGNPGRTLLNFKDEGQIASWAKESMTMLVETDTISGNGEKLIPLGKATRAEMAQVLYNLMTK